VLTFLHDLNYVSSEKGTEVLNTISYEKNSGIVDRNVPAAWNLLMH
jgi:hypothetical protein